MSCVGREIQALRSAARQRVVLPAVLKGEIL